ncbi:deubiquitinase OTUD6B-like [Anneissia japonica]|uniref:deubiquitinase OTUD6B-like n=1 Tax=Anneissia japonica TaxID=1529436 RepID=UPI0014258BEF|nr:deubiquitinase OTUD6B-like [Anneissia japonica]
MAERGSTRSRMNVLVCERTKMGDCEGSERINHGNIAQRHKRERKELNGKIQAMKHAIPKGDKKKKKETTIEIAKLEAELNNRQEEELKNLIKPNSVTENGIETGMEKLNMQDKPEEKVEEKVVKTTRAQKRRNKKANKEKEREQRIAEEESNNVFSNRKMEEQKINAILTGRGLCIREIASDGHCLYNALIDQLARQGVQTKLQNLREQTAEYMRSHMEDFLYFLCKSDSGEPYTPEEYEEYCREIANTAAWGGQHEINAISHIYQSPIEVIQADSPPLTVGEHFSEKHMPLILS